MSNINLDNLLEESKKIAGKETKKTGSPERKAFDNIAKQIKSTFVSFAKDIVSGIDNWNSGKGAASSSFTPAGRNENPYKTYIWHHFKPLNISEQDKCLLVIAITMEPKEDKIFMTIGLQKNRNVKKYRDNIISKEYADLVYESILKKFKNIDINNSFTLAGNVREFVYNKKLNSDSVNDFKILFKKLIDIYKEIEEEFPCLTKDIVCEMKQGDKAPSQKEGSILNEKVQPLNQILYGPPGTGKTYKTINKALEIILNLSSDYNKKTVDEKENELVNACKKILEANNLEIKNENRDILKDCFEYYKSEKQGQVEFITFHQSYGYEEFVEGIKAETTEDGNIKYEVQAGIFKKLSEKASTKSSSNIDEKIEWLKSELVDDKSIDIQYNTSKFNVSYRGGKTFKIKPNNTKNETTDYPASIENIIKLYKGSKKSDVYNATYTAGILEYLYSNGLRRYDELIDENDKNYVLIIDEINRGNISKIFGELITLIEPSKRIGAKEEVRVKLTYSEAKDESFGVPKNLYIIGTMNTADRSIAQIDTALRRRFVFEEMMPKPKLLKDVVIEGTEISVQKILEALNERIEYIYDREHTIGHSYFMPLINEPTIDKLNEVFKVNIIPLLAEYFYGDWGDIVEILNDDKGYFITDKTENLIYKPKTDRQNKVYKINKTFQPNGYINIYNGLSESKSDSES